MKLVFKDCSTFTYPVCIHAGLLNINLKIETGSGSGWGQAKVKGRKLHLQGTQWTADKQNISCGVAAGGETWWLLELVRSQLMKVECHDLAVL